MPRYLVSADLHLHAFLAHNFYPGFRLDQFRWVADWWADLVRAEKLDAVLVAGDFFHVPTPPPSVLQAAIEFIRKIPVPLIVVHGQHDLDARQVRDPQQIRSHSLVQVISEFKDHFYYLHHDYFQLGEDLIYGMGWEPTPEWPELDLRPKILLTHGSVRGAKFGSLESWEGFDPEKLPADWAFIGDIHQFQWVGRILIPGPPIHHTFSDKEAGVVLFDSSDGSWERVSSGYVGRKRRYKFLQLLLGEEDALDPEERLVMRKRRSRPEKSWKEDLEVLHWDLRSQLAEKLPAELLPIHQELQSRIPPSTLWPDLRFRLHWVRIRNVRSIEELELDFREHRLFLLSGLNGSGKSSLVEALRYAFFGARSGADLLRRGAKELSVELEMEYRGETIRILRGYDGGRNYLRFWVGEAEVESNSLRAKEEKLSEILPFLGWLQTLGFFGQFRVGLIAPLSQRERIELFSRIFGLEFISQLYREASSERSKLKSHVEALFLRLQKAAPDPELLAKLEAKWPEGVELPGAEELKRLKDRLEAFRKDWMELGKKLRLTETLQKESQSKIVRIQQELRSVQRAICPTCLRPLSEEKKKELQDQFLSRLREEGERLVQLKGEIERIQGELHSLERAISQLEEHYNKSQALLSLKEEIASLRKMFQTWETLQASVQQELASFQKKLDLVEKYLEWVSPKSAWYRAYLDEVSKKLSESGWEVRTYRVRRSGEVEPDFSLALEVGGQWIEYDSLSGGQRLRADMYLLRKILELLGGIGLLVFDETFRVLDSKARLEISDLLLELPAANILLISHDPEFPEYDQLLIFELEDGRTRVRTPA